VAGDDAGCPFGRAFGHEHAFGRAHARLLGGEPPVAARPHLAAEKLGPKRRERAARVCRHLGELGKHVRLERAAFGEPGADDGQARADRALLGLRAESPFYSGNQNLVVVVRRSSGLARRKWHHDRRRLFSHLL
jgi:hypothetical protein